jgi:hypothetical protein
MDNSVARKETATSPTQQFYPGAPTSSDTHCAAARRTPTPVQLLGTAAHLPSLPGELLQQLLEESMVMLLLLLNQWSAIRSSIRVCIQSVICIWRSVCKARFSNTPGTTVRLLTKSEKNLQYQHYFND